MVPGPTTHPGPETLRAFGEGRLPPEDAAGVEQHLADCEGCCLALAETPADSFVARLRQARDIPPAGDDEAPTRLGPGSATPLPAVVRIPPELAGHPRYRVLRLLGRGGMGAVYLAEHLRMGRLVALKVINDDLWRQPGALARFQQEVRAAAQLDHPNLVAALDADQAGDLHFLVMEYVEGRNLADHLAENGPLPLAEAADIARQAALGLQHAHERGMIHRDVKPHNLMRTAAGEIKLLDFGLARLAAVPGPDMPAGEGTGRTHLTAPGTIVGTPDYIAPEQGSDPRGADGRADLYSLGCTLYHLLAGQPPFPEGTVREKLARHAAEEPRSLRELRAEVPKGLAAVVAGLMAKRPEDRFPTPAAAAAALAPYARPASTAVPSRPRSRMARRILLTLLLVATLGTAAAVLLRLSADRGREVVIETDDPDIEITVQGDRIVRLSDPNTGKAYRLDRDNLTLGLADGEDGLEVTLDDQRPVVLKRRGKRIAVVHLEREPATSETPNRVGEVRWFTEGLEASALRTGVAFSPDGRLVYAASLASPNAVLVWDRRRGSLVKRLATPGNLFGFALSADGRLMAAANPGTDITVSSAADGRLVRRLTGPKGGFFIQRVAFAPAADRLAAGDAGGRVFVWDLSSGQPLWARQRPPACRALAFSPDGRTLAVGGNHGPLLLHDAATGKETGSLQMANCAACAFSRDGRRLATGGDSEVLWWDVPAGKLVRRFAGHTALAALALAPDERHLATAAGDGALRWWDLDTGAEVEHFAGHPGGALAVAVSPDGRQLLSSGADGTVRLWGVPGPPAPEEVRRWSHGHGYIHRIVVSPDGRSAWTAGDDCSQWDLTTGERLRQVGTRTFPEELLPSPDGRTLLLTDGWGGGAQLHDAATLKPVGSLVGGPPRFWQAAWLPDGRRVLTGGQDGIARLWDVSQGKVVREFPSHIPGIMCVDANRDGTLVLTGGCEDGTVRVWGPDAGNEVCRVLGQCNQPAAARFTPDGRALLTSGKDGIIRHIAIPSGEELRSFHAPGKQVSWDRLCLLADGRHFLSSGSDQVLRLWELETGRELYRADIPRKAVSLAATPDGRHALIGSDEGTILQWRLPAVPPSRKAGAPPALVGRTDLAFPVGQNTADPATGEVRRFTGHQAFVSGLACTPDGRFAVSASGQWFEGSRDFTVRVWDVRTGREVRKLQGEPTGFLCLAISPDGRHVFAAGYDRAVRMWELETGRLVRTFTGHDESVFQVVVTPDGKRLLSAGEHEADVRLWDVATGRETGRLRTAGGECPRLAVAPDGRRAFSTVGDGIVRIWDLETCREIRRLEGHDGPVRGLAIAPDGKRAVTAGDDHTLRWWDVETGRETRRRTTPAVVHVVAFSPDGRLLVTGGGDNHHLADLNFDVRLLDAGSGQAVFRYQGHTAPVSAAAFLPDGRHVVSGGWDTTVRLWRVPDALAVPPGAATPRRGG
jgi:WD40 repeat protein/serine/threonine protein kinase